MLRIFLVLCLALTGLAVDASPARQADRFLIAQFEKTLQEHELDELTAYSFIIIKPLNPAKTLYRLGFDSRKLDDAKIYELLRKVPYFLLSQPDEPIQFRKTIPNDSLFSKEWHLGKIKAAEAWDLTRSGVNRRGDTIVIAVVDDGLHVNNPEFQGNIWINYADTMDNGIDDDNNGFIDDHYGWNFVSRNKDISDSLYYNARHGSPVAGIIGARVDNVIGISGIMWNVKLMLVNVADTSPVMPVYQSDVLAAYSYVLHQRKLYNASGGKQGAFVVATNSSWGANNRFPHQAPLWCAMYDSLGKYGILNCSAVTNTEGLVETMGDLPTLCTSSHLIAVSSSSAEDKPFSSGYSMTSVDLSAPGVSIYSTNPYTKENIESNDLYNNWNSGTSFATPMVTAAVGVLHSYACERILDSIKANPAKGNLLMRKFILEGADFVQELAGKSVTGARLNILRSLQIMDQYCLGLVNVQDLGATSGIRLFPNPGNGVIQVVSDQAIESVECYDMAGKLVSSVFDGEKLSMGDVESGIYLVRIYSGGQVLTYRYVKLNTF